MIYTASFEDGKNYIVSWVKSHFPKGSTCLDVGACDGKWYNLLGDYLKMDAVEIFVPNIEYHHLRDKYLNVFCGDVADFQYQWYDLIIFGDVIEHMSVQNAQKVIEYAKPRCKDMIISVPFQFPQEEMYGNKYEKHIQDDLTSALFDERYPGFRIISRPDMCYAYYAKENTLENGGLSLNNSHKPILDIIITHYNEPVEVGRQPFNMLMNQRLVDVSDVHIIIVQDGPENAIDWSQLIPENFPYSYNIISIPHGGVSAARNAGIDASTAEYIMFSDFDDMFSDVWSLCMIMKVLPNENYDVLWMPYTREVKVRDQYFTIAKFNENHGVTCGKIFNTEFVKSHNIRFDTRLKYCEDCLFYLCAVEETSVKRYGKITTEIVYPYMQTYREGSTLHTKSFDNYIRMLRDTLMMNIYLIDFMTKKKKNIIPRIANAVYFAYFILNRTSIPDEIKALEPVFADFYMTHKKAFMSVRPEDAEYAYRQVERSDSSLTINNYSDFGVTTAPLNSSLSVSDWLRQVENKYTAAKKNNKLIKPDFSSAKQTHKKKERAAVYTGTHHVYENMLVSAKSLIANSNVDKVYFLIEDDKFPYELPDIIQTINVSNQQYFTESCPNYNTAWTYMCLLRAAFSKYFPDHDRILSLDVDTITVQDVSELWDMDLSDAYIAGVQETDDKKHGVYSEDGHAYFNFGVIMMNLDKLRKDRMDDRIISDINHNRYGFPEQDSFNVCCDGHTLSLPSDYNNTVYYHLTDESRQPKINHYAGITYYKCFEPYQTYENMSWDQVMELHDALAKKHS